MSVPVCDDKQSTVFTHARGVWFVDRGDRAWTDSRRSGVSCILLSYRGVRICNGVLARRDVQRACKVM